MATGEEERFMMRGAGGVVGAAARDEERAVGGISLPGKDVTLGERVVDSLMV